MHDLRMALPALCAWATASVAVGTNSLVACGFALAGVGLASLLSRRRRAVVATMCLMSAVAMAAVGAVSAWRMTEIAHSPVHDLATRGQLVTIDAVVSRDARTFRAHGSAFVVVDVSVRRVAGRQDAYAVRAPVTVFATADADRAARLSVGESFTAIGRLSPSSSTDKAAELNAIRLGPARQDAWWWGASSRMRAAVTESVSHTGAEPSALIPALVHGDDQRLNDRVKNDFRTSGLTHLLAVSGTNLTIVLVTLLLIGRASGVRRRGQWVLGVIAVVGFILLARPDPSVLRAAAMGVVGLAGLGYGRRGGVRALSWAVIGLMMVDPWLSRSLGFILSTCATAGILLIGPRIADAFRPWMPEWLAIGVAVPIAAQLACTPVIAAISGQVSIVAILANILADPAVAPATVLGLAGGAVALVSVPVSHLVGLPAGLCVQWILAVGHWTASLPGASIGWGGPLWLLGVLCFAAVGLILWLGARPALFLGLALGLAVCMWRPPTPGWPPDGWVMVACDIGQGDASVLNAGNGSAVVIDARPDPSLVDACLRRLHIGRVVLMVFTHGHADHIDGWDGVTRGRRVDQVMVGPTGGPGGAIPRHQAVVGEKFGVGEMQFQVLGPPPVPSFGADSRGGSTTNNASVVLMVAIHGIRIMMSGDAEPEEQDFILRQGFDLHADILKMPHHGSARQSREFFESVGARAATISDGKDNDYGHPAPTALALLAKQHMTAYRTDRQGDIAIVVRDGKAAVLTRR